MKNEQWAIGLILVAFCALSFLYSVVNPLHEATDELRHYRFVRHIVELGALPVQGEVGCSAQGHHPPLYYAVAAVVTAGVETGRDICYEPERNPFWAYRYWDVGDDNKNQYIHGPDENFPWTGEALAAHLARLVNVLFGAATVFLTWLIGRTIWEQRPFLAVGGAAIVAFNPMFLYMSGAINNDVVAAFSGALVTLACVRLLRDERGLSLRWGFILGAAYGVALMSKFNLAAIGLTIGLTVTWVAWRKRQWRQWLLVALVSLGVAAVLSGWWFVRNQILYGEPTGFQRLTELWGVREPSESWGVAIYELPYVWTSLWGRFGYGQIPLPQIIYDLLWWIALFALAGILIPLLRRDREELRAFGVYLAVLALNVFLFAAVVFNYLLVSPAGPMGRFFFPALPSLALLIFYGFSRWPTLFGKQGEGKWLSLGVSLGLVVLSLVALFGFLQPAFARPETFEVDTAASARLEQTVPNPTSIQFGKLVQLHGYSVSTDHLRPGEYVDIDLYWEVLAQPPGNYLLFVHLIDEVGALAAQRDTHPGLGNFPSRQWQPGDRFVESVRLYLPESAYTPAQATLSIGFYAQDEGYRLGVTSADGTILGDALPLAEIDLLPSESDTAVSTGSLQAVPNAQSANFEDQIRLLGYEYNQRTFQPRDVLAVTLYWQAEHNDLDSYEVQIRLLDAAGNVIQTHTAQPQDGQSPTGTWKAGETIADTHLLSIGKKLPPGSYQIQLALIEKGTTKRLNMVAADGHWLNERLFLAEIQVVAEE